MSLTAPVDGAVVGVSRIYVAGTIAPTSARLRVSGKPVHIVDGAFKLPVSLPKGLTRIRIEATASGFAPAAMVVAVRYDPSSSVQQGSSGGSSPGTGSGSSGGTQAAAGLSPAAEAEAVNSCANGDQSKVAACKCAFDRLAKAGFNTQSSWAAVVANWRRSFLSSGTITFPPVMRQVIIACAQQFRGQ